ncbi:MAG: hypothetical protein ACKVZJ_05345 [Phycisphaerales bacterium]
MKAFQTTAYFREQVLSKRPYLTESMILFVMQAPIRRALQSDGRVRLWGQPPELSGRVLRVVLLDDGATVHNAFIDRGAEP